MYLTNRRIHIEPSQVMMLAQHSSGLHTEAEIDCPDCVNDARETPDDFAPTDS